MKVWLLRILQKEYPNIPVQICNDLADAIITGLYYAIAFLIVSFLVFVVFEGMIRILLPHSTIVQMLFLNTFARHQVAYTASLNKELIEAQKVKILQGKGLGMFPCLSKYKEN